MGGSAGHNKAIDELLNSQRYEGAISSIGSLVAFCDSKFIMLISFVAWFIISVAILRNVIAGAYAAYPRFWDWVADCKSSLRDNGMKIAGRDVSIIGKFISFFIPDFKNLSDFRDDNIDPKSYFVRAIPQMFIVAMIGVCIYNGYNRDVLMKVAEFGSIIIEKIISDTDPETIYSKVFETALRPKTDSSSDNSTIGKYTDEITNAIYAKVISNHKDIKSNSSRSALMSSIENWVASNLQTCAEYFDTDNYRITKEVTRVFGTPNTANVANGDEEGVRITRCFTTAENQFDLSGSRENADEQWSIKVIIRFERKANNKGTGNLNFSAVQLNVPKGAISPNASTKKTTITLSGDLSGLSANAVKVDGVSATLDKPGCKLIVDKEIAGNTTGTLSISGLSYQCTDSSGKFRTYTISKIVLTGATGNTVNMSDAQHPNVPAWGFGNAPAIPEEQTTADTASGAAASSGDNTLNGNS